MPQTASVVLPLSLAHTTLELPPQAGAITALAWSQENIYLAAVSSNGMLLIWHIPNGTCCFARRITRECLCSLAWSEQNKCLLIGSTRGRLGVFHLASQSLVHSTTFPQAVSQIALSPSTIERRFFVRTGASLYVFTQGQQQPRTLHYGTPLLDACWTPDGQALALVCANGLVEVCDIRPGQARWQYIDALSSALRVAWDVTGHHLAIGLADGTIQMHNPWKSGNAASLTLARFPIHTLGWGEHYLVAGSEHEVIYWNDTRAACQRQPTGHVPAFAFDRDGTVLATVCEQAVALTTLI